MSFLILPGRNLNILDGALSITATDPEAGYDEENVANSVPSHPFRFDDVGTDDSLIADLDRLTNGDMEAWAVTTVPDGWEVVTGTAAREGTIKHGGSYSCKLLASSTVEQIIWVPSGWDMTLDCWLRGDGTYFTQGYLRNLRTGNWLTSGGAWQASITNFGAQTAGSYAQFTRDFTVESYSTCGYQHLVPLRLQFQHQASGTGGYCDDISMWPHWDFASIHGHNIPPNIAVKVQRDDNAAFSSATTEMTPTVIQPSFFDTIGTSAKERYARLLLEGSAVQTKSIYIGEWVLGQYKTLTKGHGYGPDYMRVMPTSQVSAISRTPRSDWSHRGLRLDFTNSDAALTNMYEMLDRARGGADPFVVVPIDTESDVMFGHFPTDLSVNRIFTDHQGYQLEFREMAFPFTF